jgi:hypothetical protein
LDRAFLPKMLEQRSGVIIHISSIQRTLPLYDFTFISSLLLPLQLDNDDHAIGMYTTVLCAERGDSDPSAIRTSGFNARLVRTELKGAQAQIEVCKTGTLSCCRGTSLSR